MQRVADYIMSRISEFGVKHLFYVPGGQCVFLTDALRRCEGLQGISMHHEQAVAMAALSYATMNESMGAGLVTTGCAGTNTMTGVLHAYQDSIPMLIVSGQQNYVNTVKGSGLPLRQVGIQEADIETIMKPVTKYAVTVAHAEEIAWHLDKALYLATHGRKGPVWIDVPLDVQNTMVDETSLIRYTPPVEKVNLQERDLKFMVDALNQATRPVLLVGNGVRSSGAKKLLLELAHRISCPVVLTPLAYDLLPYDDPCCFGIIGGAFGANRYANFTVQNADLVLAVGSRLSIPVTGPQREDFAREAVKIAVDVDAVEHAKRGVHLDRFVHADAGEALAALLASDLKTVSDTWMQKCRHWKEIFEHDVTEDEQKPIDMLTFMIKLSTVAPDGTVYVSDAGFTGAASPSATRLKAHDRFVLTLSQGEMGYALPGACGIAAFDPQHPVVSYNGDGSFMMNLQELQTVVRNQFNIKIVITNNNGYSGVRHGQKAHFRGKTMGTDPSCGVTFPSYQKIAEAFGLSYRHVSKYSELDAAIAELFGSSGPCILEVDTDPEQYDFHNGLVTYGKRKFGFRPIEDQSPYLERGVFFEEMIVEPLETSSGKPV